MTLAIFLVVMNAFGWWIVFGRIATWKRATFYRTTRLLRRARDARKPTAQCLAEAMTSELVDELGRRNDAVVVILAKRPRLDSKSTVVNLRSFVSSISHERQMLQAGMDLLDGKLRKANPNTGEVL